MNNTDKYLALRKQYPVFEYVDYHYRVEPEGMRLWFDFRMGDIEFHPTALVERRPFLDLDIPGLDRLVFDIGMVELVSYWKCACPPTVKVHCGSLTDSQVAFWRKLYWHGLGEFFYTNGIDASFDDYMHLNGIKTAGEQHQVLPTTHYPLPTHYLVPVGGGKDSVVTLELLRRAGKDIRPLIMNPRGATVECARVAGFPMDEVLVIRRTIDPTLLDLNARGYLNGHTPFSAMLAFYTRLASALSGIPNVALSNESSANESTVLGSDVNHQYSKSLEFEDDFRHYCPDFNYFSFLRPLSELQIAMLFSRFTAYHEVFRSCNVGSKQDIWCGHCAKCLFAYIILSPFIAPARLNAIFGKPMLDDLSLQLEFRQLLGEAETKPFECVGTVGEVRQALSMALSRWYPADHRPALLKNLDILDNLEHLDNLEYLENLGNLSPEERQILQAACTEKTK
ncbi:MAG: hypothetical protein K6E96_09340 [Bacteroidales bacterium]|nr:hypothetical protein [Bacteroidales bacterium]